MRMYVRGGPSSGIKKSTRCEKFDDAKEFAISWYEDRLLEKRTFKDFESQSFSAYAGKFQENQKRLIRRGELVPRMYDEDRIKLERDLLPHFGQLQISKIDYNSVDSYIDDLKNERDLSQSTLKKHVVLIRKVLKEGERDGTINYIPSLPTIKRKENPRPWFSPDEYKKLLSACRDLRDNPTGEDKFEWDEMYDLIVFLIHTFLRPSEWKYLKNRHIRVLEQDGVEQLIISVPNPKTMKAKGTIDSTSTEVAADLYKRRILPRHDSPGNYLFFNHIRDRERWCADRVSRKFRVLCKHAGLETDRYGQKHTTYSLRHSALCYQILKTKGNDLFGLAKNARTSVMMLEGFYLKHLSPQLPEFTKQLRTKRILEIANP